MTSQLEKLISHTDDSHFIVNLFALHNAEYIRSILPRHLTGPTSLHLDRKSLHFDLATKLRITQTEKRAKTQEKRQATLAAKKAKQKQQLEPEMECNSDEEQDSVSGDMLDDIQVTEPAHKRRRVN